MSILTVSNIGKSFGTDLLFSGVTFSVAAGQKVGLVGRNGGGKTTLLRILLGMELADTGKASLASGRRLSYLKQEAPVHPERTVREEADSVFDTVRQMQADMTALEHDMGDAADDAALEDAMNRYSALRDAFDAAGGYRFDADVDGTLEHLGFRPQDMDKRVGSCSGGEQTRLALAKIVLSRPDLLVLDEPTNHLDIHATEWLEGFLRAYEGAVLLVSHDRYFLDAVVDTVADLENQKLTLYKGNYSHFRQQKQEQMERQAALYAQQQAEKARLEAIIKRNMGADSISSAMRHKMQGRIAKMDVVDRPREDTSTVRAQFDAGGAGRIGRDVARMEGLSKHYGDRTLFSGLDVLIERGDRVGLVGPNGAGKTTLVKILLGTEQPTHGSLLLGHNVRLSYFSQHASDSLDPQRSVIETLTDRADLTETEARSYLARFLFTGDDVFKPVSVLSGGEKNKLALACMILEPCNLLVLDEPTNHLDIASCEALTEMLSEYGGTLLLVSHDRYLLNAVTTKTLALPPPASGSALFEGNYAAWRTEQDKPVSVPTRNNGTAQKTTFASNHGTARTNPSPPPRSGSTMQRDVAAASGNTMQRDVAMNAHALSKARIKAKDAVQSAEAHVQLLEKKIADAEECLARPSDNAATMVTLAAEHTRLQDDLSAAFTAWEDAVKAQEALN